MKKASKSVVVLCLICAMILAAVSCTTQVGNSSADTENNTSNASVVSNNMNETEMVIQDDLPDDLVYDGRELRVLSTVDWAGRIDTYHASILYEDTGDVLDSALYHRNSTVCERFNIKIIEADMTPDEAKQTVVKIVNADDDLYDIVSLISQYALPLAVDNMLYKIDEIPYIDLSKSYWNKSINESMSIAGRNIFAVSDTVLTGYDYTHVLIFNKQMADSLHTADLYTLVENGQWTYEQFEEAATLAAYDLNGDSVYNENDRYGWLAPPKQVAPSIWVSGGATSITNDESGNLVFSMNNDKMLNLLETAYNLSWGSTFWYQNTINGMDIKDPPIFSGGRALFSSITFQQMYETYYRNLNFDYGILPYPKYSETQELYYSRVESASPYCVPITVKDTEFSGAMLEALACESRKTVIPAYYEVALKVKFTNDNQSARVLDLVMANRIFDLGDTIFCEYIRDGFVYQKMNAGKKVMASDIESNCSIVETQIKKLVDLIHE